MECSGGTGGHPLLSFRLWAWQLTLLSLGPALQVVKAVTASLCYLTVIRGRSILSLC